MRQERSSYFQPLSCQSISVASRNICDVIELHTWSPKVVKLRARKGGETRNIVLRGDVSARVRAQQLLLAQQSKHSGPARDARAMEDLSHVKPPHGIHTSNLYLGYGAPNWSRTAVLGTAMPATAMPPKASKPAGPPSQTPPTRLTFRLSMNDNDTATTTTTQNKENPNTHTK